MRYTVLDLEANGLLNDEPSKKKDGPIKKAATRIHCLSFAIYENAKLIAKGSITDYNKMIAFIQNQTCIIGHRIIMYDKPLTEKILGFVWKESIKIIDTLAVSYYLFPIKSFKHGLEFWGERFGYPKPKVVDWENEPIEVYIHRCEEDVVITEKLFHYVIEYLYEMYDGVMSRVFEICDHLTWKQDCLREQYEVGIPLNQELCQKSIDELDPILQAKIDAISAYMPKKLEKSRPKIFRKKNGELSVNGVKWMNLLKERGLPEDTTEIWMPGNPGSDKQLKPWLLTIGWIPETFKVSKATGEKLPQINLPFGKGLCPSIIKLIKKVPYLKELEGYFMVRHRLGLFKAYQKDLLKYNNGRVVATGMGYTNTLRMTHSKPIANLPKPAVWYGKQVRGCLYVDTPETHIMCGSDISGLEDNTKQHFIYFYDPKYVEEMRVPGFDAHVDIAVLADLLTREQEKFFRWYNKKEEENEKIDDKSLHYQFTDEEKAKMKTIKTVRGDAKVVNFSATYGAGAPKIAETLECDLDFAQNLHNTYWERNKAVKITANKAKVKKFRKQKWLWNPVSKMWLYLKAEKDRFSTLNQSTGAFVFDTWLKFVREAFKPLGIKIALQYHDELLFICLKSQQDQAAKILKEAMRKTNSLLKLNIEINISIDWGYNYAECH